MKITKVCCQGCGATLDVDESIRYVTCNHCGSRLEVVHDPSVTHTKVLEKIEQVTDHLKEEVRVLKLQNELSQLDREWNIYREGVLIRGQNGQLSEPSMAGAVIGGLIAMIGGVTWTIVTSSALKGTGRMGGIGGFTSLFPLFGLLIAGVGVFMLFSGAAKASEFNQMRGNYERRRRQLERELQRRSPASWKPYER
jgi:DNA-directed RNA polymerase subunit RPC12/RpoP